MLVKVDYMLENFCRHFQVHDPGIDRIYVASRRIPDNDIPIRSDIKGVKQMSLANG
jgi:hypothetical protein